MFHHVFKAAVAASFVLSAGTAFAGEFDGAYAGVSGHAGVGSPPTIDVEFGAFAGYNYSVGSGVVVGGEADISYNSISLWGSPADWSETTVKANARAGYELTDNVMVYGKAGAGYTTAGAGSAVWSVGAGADIKVMDNVLLRTEGERVDPATAGMVTKYNAKVGVGYSF